MFSWCVEMKCTMSWDEERIALLCRIGCGGSADNVCISGHALARAGSFQHLAWCSCMDYRGHVSNYTVQLGYAWSGDAGGYTAEGDGLSSLWSRWAGLLFRQGPFCPSAATSSALSSRRRTEAKSTHLQQLRGVLCTISASQSFPPPVWCLLYNLSLICFRRVVGEVGEGVAKLWLLWEP